MAPLYTLEDGLWPMNRESSPWEWINEGVRAIKQIVQMRANVFMFNGFIPIYSRMGEMLTADRNGLVAATLVAGIDSSIQFKFS